jgi:hypothetical protein
VFAPPVALRRDKAKAPSAGKSFEGGTARASRAGALPQNMHRVLASAGTPLDRVSPEYFSPRFAADAVKVHDDAAAHRSAAEIGARAYAFGDHIVFGRGALTPQRLAHELAHIAQQPADPGQPQRVAPAASPFEREAATDSTPASRGRAPSGTVFLDRDPAAGARYPSVAERGDIQAIIPPKPPDVAPADAAPGTAASVTDPEGFRTAMTERVVNDIDARLPKAEKVRDAAVQLTGGDLNALAGLAEERVKRKYGRYIEAGGTDLRQVSLSGRLQFIRPPDQTSAEHIAGLSEDIVTTLMQHYSDILDRFNVVAGSPLFIEVRDAIVASRTDALKTIVLFIPGFETPSHNAFVQSRVPAAYSMEPEERTRRRGRWEVFGTTVHEMLHSVAHKDFTDAADQLKLPDVFVEGGAEFFTLAIYGEAVEQAAFDDALRLRIEGIQGPRFSPPERHSLYEDHVAKLRQIVGILGNDEENFRAAFFMGRVEFLGLGGWNEAEAERRYRERFPAWELGLAAVASLDAGTRLARLRFGRVVLGRTGALQLDVGAGVTYLSLGEPGQPRESRLGAGLDVAGRYQSGHFFIGAGLFAGGSAALRGEGADPGRAELIPRLQIGAHAGRFRIGGNVEVYVPLTGEISPKTERLMVGLGASVEF